MKAPAFEYIKPRTIDHVFALLAEYGDEARLLAGGQTLMATLNMRLSEPAVVIDITGIDALRGIALSADGSMLRIGALVTHSEIEAWLFAFAPSSSSHASAMGRGGRTRPIGSRIARPVGEASEASTATGSPSATMCPPLRPPPGPRSVR